MPADKNLDHLYPAFRAKVHTILDLMGDWTSVHMPGYTPQVVEGFRTADYQHQLWNQGRTTKGPVVTQRDGYKRESVHQSSLAVDIAPAKGSNIDWGDHPAFYDYLAHCARAQGLEAGHDWKTFVDIDHVQWVESDIATFKLARQWQRDNKLRS